MAGMSIYLAQEYIRKINEERLKLKIARDLSAAETIRSLNLTPDEMERYQARMVGVQDRLAAVLTRYPKAPDLIR